ncbi:MAG: type IV secretory system conjugative DNA transfer family protein [Deltaproteobacteria bacterium]
MSLSKFLAKFKIEKYDLTPIGLYIFSILIALMELREIAYIYIHHIGSMDYNAYLFTLYIFIPAAAFATVLSSSLVKGVQAKYTYFRFSAFCIIILIFGAIAQYINMLLWELVSILRPRIDAVPIEMLNNAMRAATFYLPIIAAFYFIHLTKDFLNERDTGFFLPALDFGMHSKEVAPMGPLTCEVTICLDKKTNKPITTPEAKRLEATLIQGATGTGKTSTLLLPMGAIDIERKYFFRELSKELGYKALEKGLAYVDAPLSNEELNKSFSLSHLKPLSGKEEQFYKEINDMIRYRNDATGEILYRDLGVGVVDPDGEYAKNFRKIANNFGVECIVVDPMDEDSVGINPFIGKEPAKIASIISNVLKGMYESDNPADSNLFFQQVTQQAIENLSILLKVMYPTMHGGVLPTLEDMLEFLHNYELVEEMCEEMKRDPVLCQEYKILIAYFEKNFYKPPLNDRGIPIAGGVGSGRRATEQFLYGAITQLDNLLRRKDVKRLLCSRSNNIDFDDILVTGKALTVCTRRGPMGSILSKAFGMFFILAFQDAVLRRPGSENTRTPFFIYIDEFPDFVNKETETCFTLFRKYRCGLIVAIQNLSQLERTKSMRYYKQVVLANTKTQIIFGDTNVEDTQYWQEAFGKDLLWTMSNSGSTETPSATQGLGWDHLHPGITIQYQPFKAIKYKTKNSAGKTIIGDGKTNFVEEKYYQEHPIKAYNFEKYRLHESRRDEDRESAPQYDSVATSYSTVPSEDAVSNSSFMGQVYSVQPMAAYPQAEVPKKVENIKAEPDISLSENMQASFKSDKLSSEEMDALKEIITEIQTDNKQMPVVDDFSVEMGTALAGMQPLPGIIDVQPIEEDQVENPNILDKSGKIKIEVKQG